MSLWRGKGVRIFYLVTIFLSYLITILELLYLELFLFLFLVLLGLFKSYSVVSFFQENSRRNPIYFFLNLYYFFIILFYGYQHIYHVRSDTFQKHQGCLKIHVTMMLKKKC